MKLPQRALSALLVLAAAFPFSSFLCAPAADASVDVTPVSLSHVNSSDIALFAPVADTVSGDSAFAALLSANAIADTEFSGPPYYYFGDVDNDDKTLLSDFIIIKANFGKSGQTRATGDLTGDGVVGLLDFLIMKKYFCRVSPYLP